eukprot:2854238-Rhodomonas_salina.2
MTAYVFAPIAFGTGLAAFDDYVIGGRLIGVRKPNGGIRLILISDRDRRLVGQAMMEAAAPNLANYFLTAHPSTIQFAVGIKDGGPKAFHTVSSLLPTYRGGRVPTQAELVPPKPRPLVSPIALVSMDDQNAFNEVRRAWVFDAAVGVATQFYDEGRVVPGQAISGPTWMQGFLAYFEAHYYRGAALGYSARDSRDQIIIWGETGLQQGDLPASALFSMALHPVIMQVMDLYPPVFAVLYMDNIYLVGPLDTVLAAASDAMLTVCTAPSWGNAAVAVACLTSTFTFTFTFT